MKLIPQNDIDWLIVSQYWNGPLSGLAYIRSLEEIYWLVCRGERGPNNERHYMIIDLWWFYKKMRKIDLWFFSLLVNSCYDKRFKRKRVKNRIFHKIYYVFLEPIFNFLGGYGRDPLPKIEDV